MDRRNLDYMDINGPIPEDEEMEDSIPSCNNPELVSKNPVAVAHPSRNKPEKKKRRRYNAEQMKMVLHGYFFEGLSYRSAGALAGMPLSTAAVLIRTYKPHMPTPAPRQRISRNAGLSVRAVDGSILAVVLRNTDRNK